MITVKQIVILINAICAQLASTSPNPPVSPDELKGYKRHDFMTPMLWWFSPTFWVLMHTPSLLEIAAISCNNSSSLYCSSFQHILSLDRNLNNIRITTSFVVGTLMVTGGAFLRALCYRTLGRNFTYQLAIRKDHELVTHGPYAFVRHPSYTAFSIHLIGLVTCHFGPGSLWAECGLWGVGYGEVIGTVWILCVLTALVSFVVRTPEEDATLRTVFGDKWDKWAATTKYKLLPYIY